MKTWVYVDGFNLYYGALKGTPYKWLNLKVFSDLVFPSKYNVQKVKYFTARVSGAQDIEAPRRQAAYLRALASVDEIEIHYGNFLAKTEWRPLMNLPIAGRNIHLQSYISIPSGNHRVDGARGPQVMPVGSYPTKASRRSAKHGRMRSPLPGAIITEVHRMEEKGTDVNLAAHLLNDAWKQEFEAAIVISNDTDLITPIEMVTGERKLPVNIICTDRNDRISGKLIGVATAVRHHRPAILQRSQFPDKIDDKTERPASWK